MTTQQSANQPKHCPSCGAPVVSEICAYCGTKTGLHTAEADMEYPVLECKEAIINFWTLWFPMIFASAFGIAGLIILILVITGIGSWQILFLGAPFLLIGSVAFFLVIRALSRYGKVKTRGKTIQATVYGYMDDNVMINNRPAQIVKLLVQTPNGPRFLLYQLGNTVKPYGINDSIDLTVYQNYFLIPKNKEVVQW